MIGPELSGARLGDDEFAILLWETFDARPEVAAFAAELQDTSPCRMFTMASNFVARPASALGF